MIIRKLIVASILMILFFSIFIVILGGSSAYGSGVLKGTYVFNEMSDENAYLIFTNEKDGESFVLYYYKQSSPIEKGIYIETTHPSLYKINSDIAGILDCHILADNGDIYIINNDNDNIVKYEKISNVQTFINTTPAAVHSAF